MTTSLNTPTLLTLSRLIFSPLVLPLLLVYLLPLNVVWLNGVLAGVFVFFALTDYFDGYLARRFKQETRLGRILDPIADKFLVYSTLVALLAADKIYFYWVVILIGREFFVMGLRQIALENNLAVHVSAWGKAKTLSQMALLTVLIANPYQGEGVCGVYLWNWVELVLLVVSLVLSVFSAWRYYCGFMQAYNTSQPE